MTAESGGGRAAMGKVQELLLTLRNNKVVYGPGELIAGEVRIKLAAHLNFKGQSVSGSVPHRWWSWCPRRRDQLAAGRGDGELGRGCTGLVGCPAPWRRGIAGHQREGR